MAKGGGFHGGLRGREGGCLDENKRIEADVRTNAGWLGDHLNRLKVAVSVFVGLVHRPLDFVPFAEGAGAELQVAHEELRTRSEGTQGKE